MDPMARYTEYWALLLTVIIILFQDCCGAPSSSAPRATEIKPIKQARQHGFNRNHHNHYHHHHHHTHHGRPRPSRALRETDLSAVSLMMGPVGGGGGGGGGEPATSSSSHHHGWPQEQPPVLDQCCACDEAKYELVFEGLWSRYTHPDDFPENYWLAHFSDIIGASHSNEFRMWSPDTYATDGVRELAETGTTKKLESELKSRSTKTRTIIKARELRYPTLNSKTSAVFRTDRRHHLVSVLSKLGPSPDWMVGASNLELCQLDCTWATQRVVNLYLWDAGTDSGTTFTASDYPTRPQEKIHPYRSQSNDSRLAAAAAAAAASNSMQMTSPNDFSDLPGAQMFDSSTSTMTGAASATPTATSSGDQMKPFAKLTITRQRIYEKSCNEQQLEPRPAGSNQGSQLAGQQQQHQQQQHQYGSSPHLEYQLKTSPPKPYVDCRTTEWSDWSTCSSTCGKGARSRTRALVDAQAAPIDCPSVDLIERQRCLSECVGNRTCVTTDWSPWSQCSVDCGQGLKKRTRTPIGGAAAVSGGGSNSMMMRHECDSVELVETEPCSGQCLEDDSGGGGSGGEKPSLDRGCETTEWSKWSECSVACGRGVKIRTRQYRKPDGAEDCSEKLIQKQPCTGKSETCRFRAQDPNSPVDCKLSDWLPWSTCSASCGHGRRQRTRYIIQMPRNGGKPCDKLTRTQRCKDLPPCPPNHTPDAVKNQRNGNNHNNNHNQNGHQSGALGNKFRKVPMTATTTMGPPPTTTTPQSSMMEDEDDSETTSMTTTTTMAVNEGSPPGCRYDDWTQWSECEVVCKPVQRGSNKVRQKLPIDDDDDDDGQNSRCPILEELYYCDPRLYC